MLNHCTFIGRLTRDPDVRVTSSGTKNAQFSLAIQRDYKSNDGQEVDYIPIVTWGKVADVVSKYCTKGLLISVDGRLRSRSYENSNRQKVQVIELVAEHLYLIEKKKDKNNSGEQDEEETQYIEKNTKSKDSNQLELDLNNSLDSFDIMEDDIQF